MFTTFILFICYYASLFTQVSGNLSHSIRLHTRQSSSSLNLNDFPPQCQSTCTPTVTTANDPNCQAPSCQCTAKNTQDLSNCFNCVITASGGSPTVVQNAQSAINQFRDGCAQSGFPVDGGSSASGAGAGSTGPTSVATGGSGSFSVTGAGGGNSFSTTAAGPQNTIGPNSTGGNSGSNTGGSTGSNTGGNSSGNSGNSNGGGNSNSPFGAPVSGNGASALDVHNAAILLASGVISMAALL